MDGNKRGDSYAPKPRKIVEYKNIKRCKAGGRGMESKVQTIMAKRRR